MQNDDEISYCECSRTVSAGEIMCQTCIDSNAIMECVLESNLTQRVIDDLKPVKCEKCTEQFADHLSLDIHVDSRQSDKTTCQSITNKADN